MSVRACVFCVLRGIEWIFVTEHEQRHSGCCKPKGPDVYEDSNRIYERHCHSEVMLSLEKCREKCPMCISVHSKLTAVSSSHDIVPQGDQRSYMVGL